MNKNHVFPLNLIKLARLKFIPKFIKILYFFQMLDGFTIKCFTFTINY